MQAKGIGGCAACCVNVTACILCECVLMCQCSSKIMALIRRGAYEILGWLGETMG